jgi:hypothetical protein
MAILEGDPRQRGPGKLQEKLASEPQAERRLPDKPGSLTKGTQFGEVALAAWACELRCSLDTPHADAMIRIALCVQPAKAH